MKRIAVLTVLLVLVVFAMPAYAGWPKEVEVVNTPLPVQGSVEVINGPGNPVPVQGDVNVNNQVSVTGGVEVTNTPDVNILNTPVPVTLEQPAPSCEKTIVSACAYIDHTQCPTVTMLTVDADKIFVVTDIIGLRGNYSTDLCFSFSDGVSDKLYVTFNSNDKTHRTLHFNSGIPFAPGSAVIIHHGGCVSAGYVTISGYTIPAPSP